MPLYTAVACWKVGQASKNKTSIFRVYIYVCIYIHIYTRVCMYACHACVCASICISLKGNGLELNICFCKAYWLHQWCFLNNYSFALIFDCRLGFMTVNVSLNDSILHLPIIQPYTGSLAFIWQENEWIQEAKLARNYSTKERGRDSVSCQCKSPNWIAVRSNHHQCWHRESYLSRQKGASPPAALAASGTAPWHSRSKDTRSALCSQTFLLRCLSWNKYLSKRILNRILM